METRFEGAKSAELKNGVAENLDRLIKDAAVNARKLDIGAITYEEFLKEVQDALVRAGFTPNKGMAVDFACLVSRYRYEVLAGGAGVIVGYALGGLVGGMIGGAVAGGTAAVVMNWKGIKEWYYSQNELAVNPTPGPVPSAN